MILEQEDDIQAILRFWNRMTKYKQFYDFGTGRRHLSNFTILEQEDDIPAIL